MASLKFQSDLAMGKKGERHVATTLKKHYKAKCVSVIGASKGFDFSLLHANDELELFEVKTDFRAAKTGNLFFEYSCSGKPSGLTATEADRWAVLLPHLQLILVFAPKRMFKYLKGTDKAKKIVGGDRKAVEGYIIPIKHILGKDGIEVIQTKTRLTNAQKVIQ